MARTRPTYEVHLDVDELTLDIATPVRTSDVTYYDAGIWLGRETDRVFVPYRRVEAIRELPQEETTESEGASTRESVE